MRHKIKGNKVRMCPCGHEEGWHQGPSKACAYGHDHAMGGCKCLGFRSRRYSTGESLLNPVVKTLPDPDTFLESQLAVAFQQLDSSLADAMATFRRRAYEIFKKDLHAREEHFPTSPRPALREAPLVNKYQFTPSQIGKRCRRTTRCTVASDDADLLRVERLRVELREHAKDLRRALAQVRREVRRIEGSSSAITITHRGIAAAPRTAPLPQGRALLDMWVAKLSTCAGRILTYLYENAKQRHTDAEICHALEYKMSGGTSTAFATLRALDLIEGSSKAIFLKREVFGR